MKISRRMFSAVAVSAILAGCASGNIEMSKNMGNPLLTKSQNAHGIESFDVLTVDNYREAMEQGMLQQKAEIAAIVNNKKAPTFENTIVALDKSGKLLEKAEMTFDPLDNSNSTKETQALSSEMSPLLSAHNDDIYMNPALFERVKKVYDDMPADLTHEQKKVVEKIYKRFERNGSNLSDADKERLRQLNLEISALQVQFSQNLLYETNNTFVVVDKLEDLAGLPQANIDRAADMAKAQGEEGKWMFNMQRASCNPVLQYCSNRELRRRVYEAYYNRGNAGNEHDSNEICAKLVKLRLERAKLMGFDNCA